jgi:hypothetical protein
MKYRSPKESRELTLNLVDAVSSGITAVEMWKQTYSIAQYKS